MTTASRSQTHTHRHTNRNKWLFYAMLCAYQRSLSLQFVSFSSQCTHELNVKICSVFFCSIHFSLHLPICICHIRFVLMSLWCYVSFKIGGIHSKGVFGVRAYIWVEVCTKRHSTEMKHDGEVGAKWMSVTANSSEIQSKQWTRVWWKKAARKLQHRKSISWLSWNMTKFALSHRFLSRSLHALCARHRLYHSKCTTYNIITCVETSSPFTRHTD